MRAPVLSAVLVIAFAGGAGASDRGWENPVYQTVEEAVAAARSSVGRLDADASGARRFFVDLVLAEGDLDRAHPSMAIVREQVGNILVTHPAVFLDDDVQRRTIDRFVEEIPRQRAVIERRLARFSYPALPGLVYCRLVDSVDAFAGVGGASTEKMTQVGGVTYFCRYVVLPLSYVGEANLAELRRAAAANPSLDVDETIRRWQRESFTSLVNTFRHELVHVHTNSTIDVPGYSDRVAYPTWFHEGTATYLAADPHSGLSESYREFQDLFFYLAQRYGIRKLQRFYAAIFDGDDVRTALGDVYSIPAADQLFARSRWWHRATGLIKSTFWIAGLALVIAAFRGADLPFIGVLQVLAAVALGFAVATGLAEHVYGLRGPGFVLGAKLVFVLVAVVIGFGGARRIIFRRRRATSSS